MLTGVLFQLGYLLTIPMTDKMSETEDYNIEGLEYVVRVRSHTPVLYTVHAPTPVVMAFQYGFILRICFLSRF